jgi:uncharacterized protein YhaN
VRIDRLDLRAYGCFTDASLDFGSGGKGMVVVYGPNEAGKSTALHAVRDWLFGFDARDDCRPENRRFLHPYAALRFGGVASAGSDSLACIRRKGNRKTLLAADGTTALDDDALRPFLRDVSADQFEDMFGLTHGRLTDGGREIVAGEGDLGATLFAAAPGLGGLKRIKREIARRKGDLFRPRAHEPELNKLLAAFDDLKSKLKDEVVSGEEAARLESKVAECEAQLVALGRLKADWERTRSAAERLARARPLVGRLAELEEEVAPLRDALVLRETIQDDFASVTADIQKTTALMAGDERRLEDLQRQRDELPDDQAVLAAAGRLELLCGQVPQFVAYREQAAAVQTAVNSAHGEAVQILKALGLALDRIDEYDQALRLDERTRRRINALGNDRARWEAAVESARRAVHDCERQIERLQRQLPPTAADGRTQILEAAVDRLQRLGDPESELAALEEQSRALEAEIRDGLGRLGCPFGVEQVRAVSVPAADIITHHQERLDQVERERDARRQERERIAGRNTQIEAARRRFLSPGSPPTPDEVQAARKYRALGWRLVRRAWLDGHETESEAAEFAGGGTTAELSLAYEHAVQQADDLADRLYHEAAGVEERLALDREFAANHESLAGLDAALSRLEGEHTARAADWESLWAGTSIRPRSPKEMAFWERRWVEVSGRNDRLLACRARADELRRTVRTVVSELQGLLAAAGEDPDRLNHLDRIDTLASLLRDAHRRDTKARAARLSFEGQIAEAKDRLESSKLALGEAERDWGRWRAEWADAVAILQAPTDLTPAEANDRLTQFDDFHKQRKYRRDQLKKLHDLRVAHDDWREQVVALAPQVNIGALPDQNADLPALLRGWKDRLDQARAAATRRTQFDQWIADNTTARDDRRGTLTGLEARLGLLREEAQAPRTDDLPERIERSRRRRELEGRMERECQTPLRELAGGTCIAELRQEVGAAGGRDLQSEVREADTKLQCIGQQMLETSRELGITRNQLDTLLGARGGLVTRAEMEVVLARIRDRVPDYAALVLAEIVLDAAIERYRNQNTSAFLESASGLFRCLTRGAFVGLAVECDDADRPFLHGVRPSGYPTQAVPVSGMSDGTCDQLYLALRLAHLEKYVRDHGPFPVILDDILVSFDDDRARAALECLADLGTRTQVLFFTHHTRLREMALDPALADRVAVLELR